MNTNTPQQQYDTGQHQQWQMPQPQPAAKPRFPALDVPELIGSVFLVGLLLCVGIAAAIIMAADRLWSLVGTVI
jgi:hypothetical protein